MLHKQKRIAPSLFLNFKTFLKLLLSILSIFTVFSSEISAAENKSAELDSVLYVLHQDELFSGSIAISENAEIVYTNGYGTLRGEKISANTPIYLASVSKAMTATAVLSLVDERKVRLDEPVQTYLHPWPYEDITIRNLLNQTSGLHFFSTAVQYADTTEPVSSEKLLKLISQHKPAPAFEPGTKFAYDNANYSTLGALLEAVTGKDYAEILEDRVFQPAGMESASVEQSGEAGWIDWVGGDGKAVYASALDLLKFDSAFWIGQLLPDSLVQAAKSPPVFPDGTQSRYVFGRFLNEEPRPLIGHFGEGMRSKTGLWRERNTGRAYVILMPGDAIHRTAILTAVMALWNGEPYELPRARPVADVPVSQLKNHVGIYESGMGRIHITLDDEQLHLEPEGAGGSEPLIPASENVFYFGHQDLTWEFVQDSTGATTGLMLQGNPGTLGDKVE